MKTDTQTLLSKQIAINYLRAFEMLLKKIDLSAIERVVEHLRVARESGAMIYVAGNGGSAATASHWVNDLGKATKQSGCDPMRVMCLSDNIPWLTALANDEGYERVFAGQIENFAQAGDILVVISASGNSTNLVKAAELAKSRGVLTIGFLGFDGGVLKDMVDEYVWFPTECGAYQLVEDGHSMLCHILTTCLMQDRFSMIHSNKFNIKIDRPTQAVILAGGRGRRLRPMTDTQPKPMVEFHGKPFLEYLVELLCDQGFERILLLLGYLPEVIMDYFGDGSKWDVQIEYSVSSPEDLTVRRIQLAKTLLDPCFLLMYCDNYWPMQMDRMWERFIAAQVPAMITVYSNKDKYSKDSVCIDEDGYVVTFDRSRITPGLQGVEISYAILSKAVLELLPEQDALFEDAVYPELVKRRELIAYISEHRYYSVGSHERLPLTEAFLARQPTVILDRDGVLNRKPPKANYVRTWSEFEWLPGATEALRLLKEAGYRVIIVSNQAGIARGVMTESDVMDIQKRMKEEAMKAGGHINASYFCPHHWNDECECRKPQPGMLFQAQREHNLDLTKTILIGDDERDIQAADAAGCKSILVSEKYSLLDATKELLNGRSY